jgi:hypothetical protein
VRSWPGWIALLLAACSSSKPPAPVGHIIVVLTVDWEGADLSAENLDAFEDLRAKLGPVPITHFVSAAYATKDHAVEATVDAVLQKTIRSGDELAVHLHAWTSLVRRSGLEPRVEPSFLTGTDTVVDLEDGDHGFDTDLDTYDVPALRAMLRTSRQILERTHLPVSKTFRAGGYLGTPKMLLAIGDEGFAVDSSAIDPHQLSSLDDDAWLHRLAQVWPNVETTTQPFYLPGAATQLVELPITAVIDYVTTPELVARFDSAKTRLDADRAHDVFVVVAFHLETISALAGRLVDAMTTVRARPELARELVYVTAEQAAELARFALSSPR